MRIFTCCDSHIFVKKRNIKYFVKLSSTVVHALVSRQFEIIGSILWTVYHLVETYYYEDNIVQCSRLG